MGPEAVAKARDTLSVRVALEEFPLARQELQNALFTPSAWQTRSSLRLLMMYSPSAVHLRHLLDISLEWITARNLQDLSRRRHLWWAEIGGGARKYL